MSGGESKAPLVLMEQVIMVLVFALAAALCVQAFVYARTVSVSIADRDHAMNASQTLAEQVKLFSGNLSKVSLAFDGSVDYKNNSLFVYYDSDWNKVETKEDAIFVVTASFDKIVDAYCGTAMVTAKSIADDIELVSMPVAWQEEVSYE